MKRNILNIFILILSLIYANHAWCLNPEQVAVFMQKIANGLRTPQDEVAARAFNYRLGHLRNLDAINQAIIQATPGAINIYVINTLIRRLPFYLAQQVFHETRVLGQGDVVMYNAYITTASYVGQFAEARRAFNEVRERRLANMITYNVYITAAGNAELFDEAQIAFNETRERRLTDVATYNAYITAAGNTGQFDEAQMAFNEARERRLANVITYAAYITAAGNARQFFEAQMAFNKAVHGLWFLHRSQHL